MFTHSRQSCAFDDGDWSALDHVVSSHLANGQRNRTHLIYHRVADSTATINRATRKGHSHRTS